MVQGQHGFLAGHRDRRIGFHRVVIGHQRTDAAVGNPLQQARIAPVEDRAGAVQHLGIRRAVHRHHQFGKAGAQHQHVTLFDHHVIGRHDALQFVETHQLARITEMPVQVHQHATALHAVRGHVFDTERAGKRQVRADAIAIMVVAVVAVFERPADVGSGAIAVVVDHLRHPIAVGIEARADVRQRIPLRRVLQ